MGKAETIRDLECTLARGGNPKILSQIKTRLKEVKSGKTINKR